MQINQESTNHVEISAEYNRLRSVAPRWTPAQVRESVIDSFSMKWSMAKDEVAEIVDGCLATLRVWDGQSAKDVAERTAQSYGAEVVEIRNTDGSICEEDKGVKSAMTAASDFAWVGDAEIAVAFGSSGLKMAIRTGNEVVTFDEVQKRLLDGEMGDDLPCVMERFGVDYDAACDAVFGQQFQEAISLLNQARQKRPEAEKDDSLPKEPADESPSPGM